MSSCNGCQQLISVTDKICCSNCRNDYHYGCVGITKENLVKLSTKAKMVWKCPECKLPRKKGDNSNTPIKDSAVSLDDNSSTLETFNKRIVDMESTLVRKIDALATSYKDFKSEFGPLRKDIQLLPELVKSVDFISKSFDELRNEVTQLRSATDSLRSESQSLRSDNMKLKEDVSELRDQLSQLEQHARENNVEIQCVPEHSNENLVSTVLQLGKILAFPLVEKDVLSCTRVAKSNQVSKRPKSIIVKLPSPRTRDELLAACIKYNKANPADRLNSHHLGIGGDKQAIFVVEHLSPLNRSLHAQARAVKRDKKYKYCWVRRGRVFLRKDDASPAIWVKNSDVLGDLKD